MKPRSFGLMIFFSLMGSPWNSATRARPFSKFVLASGSLSCEIMLAETFFFGQLSQSRAAASILSPMPMSRAATRTSVVSCLGAWAT